MKPRKYRKMLLNIKVQIPDSVKCKMELLEPW